MHDRIKNIFKTGDDVPFIFSVWYIVLLSVCVYLFWLFKLGEVGVLFILVIGGIVLAISRDATPIAPMSFLFCMVLPNNDTAINATIFYIIGLAVLFSGAIIHIIRFKPLHKNGKIKGFTMAAIIAGIVFAMGGVAIMGRNTLFTIVVVGVGFLYALSTVFLSNTLGRNSYENLIKTVFATVLAASIVAYAQLITVMIQSGDPISAIKSKFDLSTGWGHPNYIANIIARSVPLTIYLSTKNKKFSHLWLLATYTFVIGVLLTSSRATLLVMAIVALACLIYFGIKMQKRTYWIGTIFMLFGLSLAGLGILGTGRLERLFERMVKIGTDSAGRTDLWTLGLERFRLHPIFGVGFDYDIGGRSYLNPNNTPYTPYWYHNTIVQILCCMGIVGLVAYLYFFYWQYKTMLLTKNSAVYALMFVLILMLGVSMLDIAFFTPQDYLQMLVITVVGLKALPEDKGNAHFYDIKNLFTKKIKGRYTK